MARIVIDLGKSVEENASIYYDKAKKAKKKLEGAKETIAKYELQLKKIEKEKPQEDIKKEISKPVKKEWYEKFRWFFSSEGILVIGGRDAVTNEIIIKKHADKNDIVFHTDMSGSPFFVIKTENKKPGKATMQEAADATCSFSRAWKLGLVTQSVFHVVPEQVTKTPNPGEYLGRGAFVIKGKTSYIDNTINLAVGLYKGKIMCAPMESIKKNCRDLIKIEQGREKPSDIAKIIRKKLGGEIDDIIRALPSGGIKIF